MLCCQKNNQPTQCTSGIWWRYYIPSQGFSTQFRTIVHSSISVAIVCDGRQLKTFWTSDKSLLQHFSAPGFFYFFSRPLTDSIRPDGFHKSWHGSETGRRASNMTAIILRRSALYSFFFPIPFPAEWSVLHPRYIYLYLYLYTFDPFVCAKKDRETRIFCRSLLLDSWRNEIEMEGDVPRAFAITREELTIRAIALLNVVHQD